MSLPQLSPKTADTIWIACAVLHKENSDREAFKIDEIIQKLKEIFSPNVSDSTLQMHVSSHCVANTYASPDKHRYLYRLDRGYYRLYRPDDPFHKSREDGRIMPILETIPNEHRELLDWFRTVYCDQKSKSFRETKRTEMAPSHVRITNGLIKISDDVLNYLDLREGDYISISRYADNTMLMKKTKIQYL